MTNRSMVIDQFSPDQVLTHLACEGLFLSCPAIWPVMSVFFSMILVIVPGAFSYKERPVVCHRHWEIALTPSPVFVPPGAGAR